MRLQRVAEQLQQELSKLLIMSSKDERLTAVSITGVRVSPDLQNAHVHYMLLGACVGERERGDASEALARARGWLRGELGKLLSLRRIPALEFHYDDSLQRAEHIEGVLADLRERGEMGSEDEE